MRLDIFLITAAGPVAFNLAAPAFTQQDALAHHAVGMHLHYPPWMVFAAAALVIATVSAVLLWRRSIRLSAHNHYLQDQLDQRKAIELELKQSQANLEAALHAANSANEAKRLFLANMSHELRTPLNGIIGMTGILQNTNLDDEQFDFAQTIMSSSEGLLHIINDILDYASIEASKLKLDSANFDLSKVIEDVVKFIKPMASEKSLAFTHIIDEDVPINLKGDARRLQQIVINLLSNAVKFTQTGGIFLHVSLGSEKTDDCLLRFTVRDTGIGIAPDRRDRLFGFFSQVDSGYTRQYNGLGLGLSLAKSLVDLMYGEIRVESEPHKGSVFWFTARLEIRRSLPKQKLPQRTNLIGGKRILVVDDHLANRQVLEQYLKQWQFAYDAARNASSALAKLHQALEDNTPYDLAVIDQLMPGMDGVDLGRAIRKDPLLKDIKLVMFTSLEQLDDLDRIQTVGFDAYLAKPIRHAQLLDCLMDLLAESPSTNTSSDKPAEILTDETIQSSRNNGIRVLVVEDNVINQRVMQKILDGHGCQCRVVGNGREAVDELRAQAYDVVLMDLQMPEMNGFEATSAIRNSINHCLNPQIPIIAVTANAMKGDSQKCLDAGMDDYLPKPVSPGPLMEKIKLWCEQGKKERTTTAGQGLPN